MWQCIMAEGAAACSYHEGLARAGLFVWKDGRLRWVFGKLLLGNGTEFGKALHQSEEGPIDGDPFKNGRAIVNEASHVLSDSEAYIEDNVVKDSESKADTVNIEA